MALVTGDDLRCRLVEQVERIADARPRGRLPVPGEEAGFVRECLGLDGEEDPWQALAQAVHDAERDLGLDCAHAAQAAAPEVEHHCAVAHERVARTRSRGVGEPPRWTWPSTVTRVSKPVRCSIS